MQPGADGSIDHVIKFCVSYIWMMQSNGRKLDDSCVQDEIKPSTDTSY